MDILEYADNILEHLEKKRRLINDLIENGELGKAKEHKINLTEGFSLQALFLKDLKVACIADSFTYDSYAPECNLYYVSPQNWKAEIETFSPDLMFIESAWYGIDNKWYGRIIHPDIEYYNLCIHCKKHGIPIVFWNKEDPAWTNEFICAAWMADFVFTTDIDMIRYYKTVLGHNRVYHLHFAAQPKYHNPLEKFIRKDKFCFAGAYYHKYPERTAVFDEFSYHFLSGKGLDIYDRNYQNARPEHAFPERYDPYILGKLKPEEIDVAYKGYTYNVNMNSITQSQSMFARRVIELLASNTVAVGNFSLGLKNYFGDLTICTDSVGELQNQLDKYCSDDNSLRKYRLAGLRKVLSENLYADRLAYIAKKVFNRDLTPPMPEIFVFAVTSNKKETEYITSCFDRQTYPKKKLIINQDMSELIENYQGCATMFDKNDYYGPNYLMDLALSSRWNDCEGIGKSLYYRKVKGELTQTGAFSYQVVSVLSPRRAIFKSSFLSGKTVSQFLKTENITSPNMFLSVDEFNYCADTNEPDEIFSDIEIACRGIDYKTIINTAENITPASIDNSGRLFIGAKEILDCCPDLSKKPVGILLQDDCVKIDSKLDAKSYEYIYFKNKYEALEYISNGKVRICFTGGSYGTDVMGSCIFFDAENNRLGSHNFRLNVPEDIQTAPNTAAVLLGFRVKGPGIAVIKNISVSISGVTTTDTGCFISASDTVVVTNHYPAAGNLYRNMFVHQRLLSYLKMGRKYDVLRIYPYQKKLFREFEGISVMEGNHNLLTEALYSGNICTIALHFLDIQMWNAIKPNLDSSKLRLLIWVHGAEIQPYWRREYNYKDDSEREVAKIQSDARMKLWEEVFETASQNYNIHFIFVSKYFANEVMEDYGVNLSDKQFSVIHNGIDTETFDYVPKSPEQRKRIFSLRPWASRQYANDISVNAILELSKHEEFEDMEFFIAGQGPLFDELTEPLKEFQNVRLEKSYFNHKEIADMHKEYGVCLIPTRWDSHGVSRDEAMSSGLVAVTNPVAAIPEFCTTEKDSLLVPPEDPVSVAEAILRLYQFPKLFERLSRNAAQRVRNQSGESVVIKKELELIEFFERSEGK